MSKHFSIEVLLLLTFCVPAFFAQDPEPQQVDTTTKQIEKQVKKTYDFIDDGIYFSNEFDGARLNDVRKDESGTFVVTILPENAPVNMSPWYAFKVWSKKAKEINVRLVYPEFAVHRYDPKVSRDGKTWTQLERGRITDIEKGTAESGPRSRPKSVILRLEVTSKPLWVSAQELETSKEVFAWIDALAKRGNFPTETIGLSREGRPLRMITLGNPKSRKMMLVISRQHPPEVTGYFAMQAFVEKLADDSEMSKTFRRDWGIYVIPLMNPDGVDGGHWRHNAGGIDLNRDWSDFHQPETNYVRDLLAQKAAATGGTFYFGIDFHSTWNDIYYPFSNIYEGNAPRLMHNWLDRIQAEIPNYKPNIQANSRLYPTRVSRNYFFDKYGMEAIVFEIGDNTPRDFIRKKGEVGAVELMKLLTAQTVADGK
ncbi:MAG: M14 family metallopeptidase [Pyrinomonadaceae bacterium]